jgi:metal-responsive CopG/Arc/MetJ family transcriptional regulator
MQAVRVNVSLPRETFEDLSKEIEPRKRSRFVAEAIERLLRERRAERLAREYREAADEIRRVNRELEGALNDGLD